MASIPAWCLGRNTVVAVTFLSVDPTGFLSTAAATQSLQGTLEEVDIDSEVQHENLSPMDVRTAHNVIVDEDFVLNLTQITLKYQTNILAWFATSYDYAYFLFTRGNQQYGAYMTRGNFAESWRKGRCTARLQVRRVNIINEYNPTYGGALDPVAPGLTVAQLLAA